MIPKEQGLPTEETCFLLINVKEITTDTISAELYPWFLSEFVVEDPRLK